MGHVTPGTTRICTHLFRESYETVHDALDRVFGGDRVALRVVAGAETTPAGRTAAVSRF